MTHPAKETEPETISNESNSKYEAFLAFKVLDLCWFRLVA